MVAHALVIDHFGNVALDVDHDGLTDDGLPLGGQVELEVGGERCSRHVRADVRRRGAGRAAASTRTPPGRSRSRINRGDAAATLGIAPDARGAVRPR